MTAPPMRAGRIPARITLVVVMIGLAALLAAIATSTSWYSVAGTLPEPDFKVTYNTHYVPGPSGYTSSCTYYYSSGANICAPTVFPYNVGNGTALLSNYWWTVLGLCVGTAVFAFAAAIVLTSNLTGRIRVARSRRWLVVLLVVGILLAAAGTDSVPLVLGGALSQAGTCLGWDVTNTPCNSVYGTAAAIGCSGGSCTQTNLAWHPEYGWYFDLAATVLLSISLLVVWLRPIGKTCPRCGGLTRYTARFCDTCGGPLPR